MTAKQAPMPTERSVSPAGPPVRLQVRWSRSKTRTINTLVFGVLLWELMGRFVVKDRFLFAPASKTAEALWRLFVTGEIYPHLATSSREFFFGFLGAAAVGVAFGTLMGVSVLIEEYADPWISALYATPLVALLPVFILTFGIGELSKAALVFTLSIFPIVINTFVGIRGTDESLKEMAVSFRASRLRILTTVVFPSALPVIISGLRIGVGRALLAVVVGEMFFARRGLGFLIRLAGETFDAPTLLAAVVVFALAGVLLVGLLKALEIKLTPWRQRLQAE